MKGIREALLAGALLLATLSIAPTANAGLTCDLPWGVASSAPLQDDARSGYDAGDVPADAVELPGHANYAAFLDPVRRDGGDFQDWYVVDVGASPDTIAFAVTRDYQSAGQALDLEFRLDVFAPGAAEPTHTTTSLGGEIALDAWTPGQWLLRVTVVDPADPLYQCGAGTAFVRGSGLGGTTSAVLRNHIVYFGCEPICADASA